MWLGSVVLPPDGGRTRAHVHEGHESAFFFPERDEVELYTGDRLERHDLAHPGDYIYVPAGEPYVAVNRSSTQATLVGARTDPHEQESVQLLTQLDALVP